MKKIASVGLVLAVLFGSSVLSEAQILFPTQAGGMGPATNILALVPGSGTLLIAYDFSAVPDTMDVYYDGSDIFSSGLVGGAGQFAIPYGPGLASDITIVMNQGIGNVSTVWMYTPEVVPEPGICLLLAAGLPTMAFWRRQRN